MKAPITDLDKELFDLIPKNSPYLNGKKPYRVEDLSLETVLRWATSKICPLPWELNDGN